LDARSRCLIDLKFLYLMASHGDTVAGSAPLSAIPSSFPSLPSPSHDDAGPPEAGSLLGAPLTQ
jgi:hypothetical protein